MTRAAGSPLLVDRYRADTRRVKCVLVGDGAVGKTSLVVSYTTNGYPTEYVPTAFDNYNVMVTVDEQPIRLQLCDTAGQDDFDTLRPLCYPGTDVFLVCFSVVSPTSFHNIRDKWLPEIRHYCPGVPVILVGTQCDLRSDVKVLIELATYQEQPVPAVVATRIANLVGAVDYVESSALTQKNLKEVFDTAILVSLKPRETSRETRNDVLPKNGLVRNNQTYHFRKYHETDDKINSFPARKTRKGWKRLWCFS